MTKPLILFLGMKLRWKLKKYALIVIWRQRGKEQEVWQDRGYVKRQGICTSVGVTEGEHEGYLGNKELWKAICI